MIRSALAAAAFFGLATFSASVHAEEPSPLVFVVDPKLGMEAGIRTVDSLGRVIFLYDRALPSLFDERSTAGRFAAGGSRFVQWLFVDTAIAAFESVVIHEVFGHGSRGRDLGQSPSFDFALPGVYCTLFGGKDNCTSHAFGGGGSGGRDRELLVDAGGIEANHLTGYWLDTRMIAARGFVHQGDLLLYQLSKLSYAGSLLSPDLDRAGGRPEDDVSNYVTDLQDRFNLPTPGDRKRISRQLRTAYLWNWADPMFWYATYASIVKGIGRGERWTQAPLPTLGPYVLYAAPRFGLSPFGAEHYIDVFAGRGETVAALYGRVGSSGLASYTGAGLRVSSLRIADRVALGGELDVWSQPETLLDDRAVYERPQIRGLNVGLSGDVRIVKNLGLTARLAYKTKGFLTGQPIDEGVYGYVGASVSLDSPAPPPHTSR